MQTTGKLTKILVLTSTFPRWANDTVPPFVMELCQRLLNQGLSVDVLAPHAEGAKHNEVLAGIRVRRYPYFFRRWQLLAYQGGILANINKHHSLKLLIPFFIVAQLLALLRQLKNNRYDLIHAHWLLPQGLLAVFAAYCLGSKAPKVLCTCHGGDLFALQSGILNRLKKWVLNRADGITVVSEAMRQACLPVINNKAKLKVCSMGVDLTHTFTPLTTVKRAPDTILFVGRLVAKKGVQVLLAATAELAKTPFKLIIVGDGPLRAELEQLSDDLGISAKVTFVGAVTQQQLPPLYSAAAIVVMPSIVDAHNDQEGLGLVAIEAMGCGCAVIASALPAVTDIIDHDHNGLLVPPGDVRELAKTMEYLMTHPEITALLAATGRHSVKKKFDWQTITKRYHDIMHQLITP